MGSLAAEKPGKPLPYGRGSDKNLPCEQALRRIVVPQSVSSVALSQANYYFFIMLIYTA
jgi:hypothetical protein